MLRNLILDWSGTLVDDLQLVVGATNAVLRHYQKRELPAEEFRERFRLPFDSFYQELLPGVDRAEVDTLFHRHFADGQDALVLLPSALEFLHFGRATQRRLFLLSTIKESHFIAQSTRLGVRDFFEQVYVDVPDKRKQIAAIVAQHGLVPNETAFIGDMVHDVETAQHGGITAIAVSSGFDSPEKLSRARPDVMVQDLGALRKLLEALPAPDAIRIEELELFARVGVPDEERTRSQRLTISLLLEPRATFAGLNDDLARTIDYARICADVQNFVQTRSDRLIETLAEAIAAHLLKTFPLRRVQLELRKFILPETKYVAVKLARDGGI